MKSFRKIFRLVLFGLLLLNCSDSFSQDEKPKKPAKKDSFWSWDKVYFGGGLGMQFGTFTLVHIAPDMGYKITDKYSAGIGLRYIYVGDRRFSPPFELNIYGASIFNRYFITDYLFLHGEYEVLDGPWDFYRPEHRFLLENYWIGGGFRQRAGNASLSIMGLWNLNDSKYNPFPNPQIRASIGIGL